MSLYTASRELHELDFFSFPVAGKTPTIANWQRERATPEKLRRWFADRSDLNIGLRMGGGVFAVDLDAKHDGMAAWTSFVKKRQVPITATALTGGGGTHLLFKSPKATRIGNAVGWGGMPGVDIRGQGGFIVVEPSIHPDTNRDYVWLRTPRMGIAPAPRWLLDALGGRRRATKAQPLGPTRSGEVGRLVADLIDRFPIAGPGQRAGAFAKVVPSALGRGYDEETVKAAVLGWWGHFHANGLCSTAPDLEMIERYIAQLKRSETFGRAIGTDHRAERQRIILPANTQAALRTPIEPGPIPLVSLDTIGSNIPPTRRLCETPHEEAFVEGLLVQALHQIDSGEVGPLKFTRTQICEIVADRHPEIHWANPQFERLKSKYIDRDGKPATRASLLRQTAEGNRAWGSKAANPSAYEPTGLTALVRPG